MSTSASYQFRPAAANRQGKWISSSSRRDEAASLLLLELAASGIITIAPGCPRWASLAVDRLTLRRDRLEGLEVWQ